MSRRMLSFLKVRLLGIEYRPFEFSATLGP